MNTSVIRSVPRPRPARRTALAATTISVLLALAGCSSGPAGAEAPADAGVDEFCEVVGALDVSDPEKFIDDLVGVGTPADIPDGARDGFEALIDNADADEVSDEVQQEVNAFFAYVLQTCGAFPAGEPTPS